MSDQSTFIGRIGRLFKRAPKSNGNSHDADMAADATQLDDGGDDTHGAMPTESRTSIVEPRSLRPWRNNSAAIGQLQQGFGALNELMTSIRDHMHEQGRRQEQLLGHLSALPRVLEMIPESNRIQGETLKAIHEQLVNQSEQQKTLGDILEKLGEAGGDHREVLEGVRERVEKLSEQDKAMADSLNNVGSAMQSVSQNASASTEVLGQLRDNMQSRDTDLERVLHRQGTRFTTMLAIAIFLSLAALTAVCVMFYMMTYGHK